MTDFLIYDLKVAVLIIVFYMFYRLMLSRETFHRVNRIVLLLTAVASFVLPLCGITMHETVTVQAVPTVEVGDLRMKVVDDEKVPLWQTNLSILYIIGVVTVVAHTLWSVLKVVSLIRHCEQHPLDDGITLCVTGNAEVAPFSWMRYIVMNRSDYEAQDAAILAHERGHIRLRHSYDVLLVDLLTALQWFNPAMWMLRQDLRAIHEYEADGAVLSQGINARQYQYLLISKAASIGGYSIANGISHSTLKNRIHMMLHKETKRSHLLKLLTLLPIIGTAIALNARTVTDVVYDEPQKKQVIKKGKQNAKINVNGANEVVVVEQAPAADVEVGTFKMRGIVVDQDGEPIVGAVITIPSSGKGAVTDLHGEFVMEVKTGSTVVAAYVGYSSESIVAKDPKKIYIFTLHKDGSDESSKTFDVVEEMPQFPGGQSALLEFLSKNIRYPEAAHKAGIQGRVVATFVVEKDGSITNAKVMRSINPLLDAEALRVINSMPNWIPGKQDGKPVVVKYTIPVTFKLDGQTKTPEEKYNKKETITLSY